MTITIKYGLATLPEVKSPPAFFKEAISGEAYVSIGI